MTIARIRPRLLAGACVLSLGISAPALARTDYIADIHVVPGTEGAVTDMVTGFVFEDLSRDGMHQDNEPGVPGVMVSNGRDVVLTAQDGSYSLPVYDDMTVFVTEPAAYDVPVNDDMVPQFFYHHKPAGTSTELRYGGLAPTGPLPAAINFPMVRGTYTEDFSCVMMGDTQPYSNTEVSYVRDSIVADLLDRDLSDVECLVMLGDVMGDDLTLLPRFMDVFSVLGLPQYYIHGNHDYDFDAVTDADSADSWRNIYGPAYFSFEIGEVFFFVIDNVVYPCGPEDNGPGGRDVCVNPDRITYNGRITDDQMMWIENTLAHVPEDKLIVLTNHIPLVSFIDSNTGRHQTDNLAELIELVHGRPVLSLSGHTHTYEHLAAGEWYEGWEEMVGITRLPFDHIVAGAPSGNWWQGDFSFDGIPMAFARGGTPPGHLVVEFTGNQYRTEFFASNQPADRKMALSFNTPGFRDWFDTLWTWQNENGRGFDGLPPVTINDLEDLKLFTLDDLAEGVMLSVNFWQGDRHAEVFAAINDGPQMALTRTQDGDGENILNGAMFADPFAAPRQMTIGRYAYESTSGEPRAQGFEIWQGRHFGPVPPQGMSSGHVADSSTHLWQLTLPTELPFGTHVATVTAVDRWGREYTDRIAFEVREERPNPRWDNTLWD